MLKSIQLQEFAGMPMTWCVSVQLHRELKQMGGQLHHGCNPVLISILEKGILNLPQYPPVFIYYHPDCTNVLSRNG